MESFCSLCHLIFISSALPGSISIVVVDMVLTISLFMTKATPTDAVGFVGRLELIIFSLRPKSVSMCCMWSSLRCVSCRQSRPIFFSHIVLCIVVHLDSGPGPHSGAERPFMLSVAIRILARDRGFVVLGMLPGGAAR